MFKNNKSTGPSSIPTKFLKLFQNAPSEQIALLANLSFSIGIFPTNLKTANVIQGSTDLIFVWTDFCAHKMVLCTHLCTQNYMYIKQRKRLVFTQNQISFRAWQHFQRQIWNLYH